MAKSRSQKRNKKLEIGLTSEELEEVEQLAATYGMTRSEFFRARTLHNKLPPAQVTTQAYWQLCQMNESLQDLLYLAEVSVQREQILAADLLDTLKILLEEVQTIQKNIAGIEL